jgi:hypothetical protein
MIQWFEPPSGAMCGGYGLVARRCRPNKELVTAPATERFAAVAGELLEHDRSLRRSPRSEREEVRRLLSGRSFDYLPKRATAAGAGGAFQLLFQRPRPPRQLALKALRHRAVLRACPGRRRLLDLLGGLARHPYW